MSQSAENRNSIFDNVFFDDLFFDDVFLTICFYYVFLLCVYFVPAGGVLWRDVHQPVAGRVRQRSRHEAQRHVRAEDVQGGGQGGERSHLVPQLPRHGRPLLPGRLRG